jgi:hypothetical protein
MVIEMDAEGNYDGYDGHSLTLTNSPAGTADNNRWQQKTWALSSKQTFKNDTKGAFTDFLPHPIVVANDAIGGPGLRGMRRGR